MRPTVSASVVLYHSGMDAIHTIDCLASSDMPVDIHIVDHSPEDRGSKEIRLRYPLIDRITPGKNLGYAAGNNLVLDHISSRYHLILNPDVTFSPGLIGEMVEFMEQHRDVVILTPRVMNPDGTEQLLPRTEPRIRYLLARRLTRFGGIFEKWRRTYTLQDVPGDRYEVQYATGCFMLIRSQILYRLHGFDERFFLYHEDSDLSRRALKFGKIVYDRNFSIVHTWSRDSLKPGSAMRQHLLSTVKYFNKWGWRW